MNLTYESKPLLDHVALRLQRYHEQHIGTESETTPVADGYNVVTCFELTQAEHELLAIAETNIKNS